MTFARTGTFLGALVAAACFSVSSLNAETAKPRWIDVYVPWNPVQEPEALGDVLENCANNEVCRGFADVAGQVIGLPPGSVIGAIEEFQSYGGRFGGEKRSEQFWTHVYAPDGYRVCDVKIGSISAAPMGNKYSPTFAATIQSDTWFELYSFVHVLKMTKGKSWVDTVATVRFARIGSNFEPDCYAISGVSYQYRCNQNNHNGQPICAPQKFGSMPVNPTTR